MPSEARQNFFENFLLFECKKVQIGPQNIIWGLKNEYFFNVLIKICQFRIEIVCRAKRGNFFLKIFLLFECKKVQFGPQNIIWGLKNGGWGGPGPRAPPLDPLLVYAEKPMHTVVAHSFCRLWTTKPCTVAIFLRHL